MPVRALPENPSEEARDDVFLNRAMAWLRLPCGIVSTLPLDALFSSRGRELDDVRPGGLGVHLIETAMDEVEYSQPDGGGMEIRLRKYLRGETN